MHRLLIHETSLLGGDTLLFGHDEILSVIEPAEVIASGVICGDDAELVVLTRLEFSKVLLGAAPDDHVEVVIHRARARVLRSRSIWPMRDHETRGTDLSERRLLAATAGEFIPCPLSGLHGVEPQTAAWALVLENRQVRASSTMALDIGRLTETSAYLSISEVP